MTVRHLAHWGRSLLFLRLLSQLALAGAVLLPIGLWIDDLFRPQPRLQWSVIERQIGRMDDEFLSRGLPQSSLVVELINTGNWPTDRVRVEFSRDPDHVYASVSPNQPVITTEGPGTVVELGHLRPDEVAQITFFGTISTDIGVFDGERQIEGIERERGDFAEPRAWLPDWVAYAGGLLLAALALEVLRLRRVLAAGQTATRDARAGGPERVGEQSLRLGQDS